MIKSAAARDERIRGLRLSRSFGHQGALTAGMWAASGDLVITMDGDLQHPPETIPALLEKNAEGYDVVYAMRSADDSEGRIAVLRARVFYWTLNRLAQLDLPPGVADFRCMSRRVVDAVDSMPERTRFLRGMTRWVGFRQTVVHYDRAPRAAGASKYTFSAMVRLAGDAILSFSTVPLKIASVLGLVVSLLGIGYGVFTVIDRLIGGENVRGYPTLAVAVLVSAECSSRASESSASTSAASTRRARAAPDSSCGRTRVNRVTSWTAGLGRSRLVDGRALVRTARSCHTAETRMSRHRTRSLRCDDGWLRRLRDGCRWLRRPPRDGPRSARRPYGACREWRPAPAGSDRCDDRRRRPARRRPSRCRTAESRPVARPSQTTSRWPVPY